MTATPVQIAIGVAIVILANAGISEGWSRRRGVDAHGWDSVVAQFLTMLVTNIVIVTVIGRSLAGSRDRASVSRRCSSCC